MAPLSSSSAPHGALAVSRHAASVDVQASTPIAAEEHDGHLPGNADILPILPEWPILVSTFWHGQTFGNPVAEIAKRMADYHRGSRTNDPDQLQQKLDTLVSDQLNRPIAKLGETLHLIAEMMVNVVSTESGIDSTERDAMVAERAQDWGEIVVAIEGCRRRAR